MTRTTAILLHGGGLGPWSWSRVVALLPFACRVPTLPGHRGSDIALFDMQTATDQIIRIAELEDEPVHLAGLSLGGQLAVHVAAARPDLVRSVVASGVNLRGIPMYGAVKATMGAMKRLSASPSLVRLSARSMGIPTSDVDDMVADGAAMDPERLKAVYQASHEVRLPPHLPVDKTLILAGSKEPKVIHRSLADFAAAGATTEVVPGGRHTWPISSPALFAARMQAWAQRDPSNAVTAQAESS